MIRPIFSLVLWGGLMSWSGLIGAAEANLSFGVVPQLPARQLHQIWRPLLQAVGEEAGVSFQLQVPKDIPTFARALNEQRYDLAYVNPGQYAEMAAVYLPLVRDHGRSLRGILVVRKGSGIETLASLRDRRIVFPDHAYAASVLLQQELRRLGLDFMPVYAPNHASVYLGVAVGLYEAGGGVWATLGQQDEGIRQRLRVLYRTRSSPPHPVIAHRRLDPALRERIRQALLTVFAQRPQLFAKVPVRRLGRADPQDYGVLEGDTP